MRIVVPKRDKLWVPTLWVPRPPSPRRIIDPRHYPLHPHRRGHFYDIPRLAIAFDATSTGSTASGTSLTVSHTCTGADRCLYVGVATFNGSNPAFSAVTSKTYAGVVMTELGTFNYGTGGVQRVTLLRLVAPATGANDIVISTSPNTCEIVVGACSFTGVHQTTPDGTAVGHGDSSTAASISDDVSSATGELVVDIVGAFNPSTLTAGAGQTERIDLINGGGVDSIGMSTEPGAATVTMSWAFGTNRAGGHIAVPIKPSAAAAAMIAKLAGHQSQLAGPGGLAG